MIGSTVWKFDENHRVYARDENGKAVGGPIYREFWRPRKVTGETTQSWITEYGEKIAKNGRNRLGWALSQEEVNDRTWVESHRHKLAEKVRGISEADKLREIAALIGYVE